MFLRTSNNTIIKDDKIIFIGLNDFINKISKGNYCFICGAKFGTKEFNDEHVIPDWILRKFNLHNREIRLTNGTHIKYGQYKIPCCKSCNEDLSREYEIPISNFFKKPYKEAYKYLDKPEFVTKLFKWLSLIFIKTHIKDTFLPLNQDLRKKEGTISENYLWEEMHHIHCICRSHYTKAIIDDVAIGTFMFLPAIEVDEPFDYIDSHSGKTVLIRIDDKCIIANLTDARAGKILFSNTLNKINAPLSPFQLKEIVAHLNFINVHLKNAPTFYSKFNENGDYVISGEIPESCELLGKNEWIFTAGQMLKYYIEEMMPNFDDKEILLKEIEEGKRNYLIDEKGDFIDNNVSYG